MDKISVNLSLKKYRIYSGILVILMYLVIYGVVVTHLENPLYDILFKVLFVIMGFGLHAALQFKFSKQLELVGGESVSIQKLNDIRKKYEPNPIYLILFFIVIVLKNQAPQYVLIAATLILLVSIVHTLLSLKNDQSI